MKKKTFICCRCAVRHTRRSERLRQLRSKVLSRRLVGRGGVRTGPASSDKTDAQTRHRQNGLSHQADYAGRAV